MGKQLLGKIDLNAILWEKNSNSITRITIRLSNNVFPLAQSTLVLVPSSNRLWIDWNKGLLFDNRKIKAISGLEKRGWNGKPELLKKPFIWCIWYTFKVISFFQGGTCKVVLLEGILRCFNITRVHFVFTQGNYNLMRRNKNHLFGGPLNPPVSVIRSSCRWNSSLKRGRRRMNGTCVDWIFWNSRPLLWLGVRFHFECLLGSFKRASCLHYKFDHPFGPFITKKFHRIDKRDLSLTHDMWVASWHLQVINFLINPKTYENNPFAAKVKTLCNKIGIWSRPRIHLPRYVIQWIF